MIHNIGALLTALANGVIGHLSIWEGWAVLIAGALFGWRGAVWWMPIPVALIINPEPYGVVAALVHGRHASLYGAVIFTLCQIALAFAGFVTGRLVKRLR